SAPPLSPAGRRVGASSTPPLRQDLGAGGLAESSSDRPFLGWRIGELGEAEPPALSLLRIQSGIGLCSQLLAQLPGVDRLTPQPGARTFERAGADPLSLRVRDQP